MLLFPASAHSTIDSHLQRRPAIYNLQYVVCEIPFVGVKVFHKALSNRMREQLMDDMYLVVYDSL